MSELSWQKAIQPLAHKNENQLQLEFGVNALSQAATRSALTQMTRLKERLQTLRLKSKATIDLAKVVAGRSLMGGPANASQIRFDKMGYDRVSEQCTKNIGGIDSILPKKRRDHLRHPADPAGTRRRALAPRRASLRRAALP